MATTTDLGEKSVVEMCRAGGGGTYYLALVKDTGFAVTQDTVYGDLTASGIECDFPGYARQAITWNAATIVSHKGQLDAPAVTFTRTSTGTAQGAYYWVVVLMGGPFGNQVMWGAPFGTPPIFASLGDALSVTPYFNADHA